MEGFEDEWRLGGRDSAELPRSAYTDDQEVAVVILGIGAEQRPADRADEEWINQQIDRRRADGRTVWVKVTVDQDGLNMVLSTPGCGAGGGGRLPRAREKEIFDVWGQTGLNDPQFTGANVVSVLKRLRLLF